MINRRKFITISLQAATTFYLFRPLKLTADSYSVQGDIKDLISELAISGATLTFESNTENFSAVTDEFGHYFAQHTTSVNRGKRNHPIPTDYALSPVSPNPVGNHAAVAVKTKGRTEDWEIQVFNVRSQKLDDVIRSVSGGNGRYKVNLDFSRYRSGPYIVRMQTPDGVLEQLVNKISGSADYAGTILLPN